MKVEVLKRGLLLLVFLFLVGVVSAAHTVDVTLINYTSFYETQNTNFSISVKLVEGDWIDKIKFIIPTQNLQIMDYKSINNYPCSSSTIGLDFIINCSGVTTTPSKFILNITAKLIDSSQDVQININTIDINSFVNNSGVYINVLNDNIPPVITSTMPALGDFVKAEPTIFNVNVFDAQTGINNGNILYDYIGIYKDTSTLTHSEFLACTQTDCSTNLNLVFNPNQKYLDFQFDIFDKAGNTQTIRPSIRIDDDLPNITLNSPLSNEVNTNFIFDFNVYDDSFNNSYKLGEINFLNPTLNCNLEIDSVQKGTQSISCNQANCDAIINANYQISPDLTILPDGVHNYELNCEDKAGYIGSKLGQFTLDRTGPNIILNTPTNGTIIAAGTLIDLDVQDLYSSIGLVSYTLNGGASINLISPYDIDTTAWNGGLNTIIISATDSLGNPSTATFAFTIDKNPPTITLVSPIGNALTNKTVSFNYNVNDDYSTNFLCSIFVNGMAIITNNPSLLGVNSYAVNNMVDGNNNWYVTCTDSVGNLGTSITDNFVTDTTPPTLNSLVCDPLTGLNSNTEIISCTIDVDDISPIDKCALYINDTNFVQINGEGLLTTNVLASNNVYTRYIACNDSAGNEMKTIVDIFYYDNIAPQISNNKSNPDVTSATITWDTDEFADSRAIYSTDLTLSLSTAVGPISLTHTRSLSSLAALTTYNYQISSTDRWGNVNDTMPISNFTTKASGGDTGGGGGGGGGGCTSDWNCSEWGNCNSGGTMSRNCIDLNHCKNPTNEQEIKKSCTYYGPQLSETNELSGGVSSEVAGNTGELNETETPTASVVGIFKTGIGYLIALLFLLAFLILTYFFYQRGKYPRIKQNLVEKDLASLKSADQPKSIKQFSPPKPAVQQNVKIPRPITQNKNPSVNDFMKNLKNGNFNKK